MTTYNGGRFLREQLDSIYGQTRVPDEVIVCDDGSTDNTLSILEEYKATKGLKYFVNNPKLGVNNNFYKAISLCSGDYIALCDQDDFWLPHKVKVTFDKICEIDGDYPVLVSSRCIDVDENLNNTKKITKIKDSEHYVETYINNRTSQGCSFMFNTILKDIILNTHNKVGDSVMFDAYIARVAAMRGIKYNLGERLMLYRHHQNNVVARINAKKLSFKEHILVQGRFRGFLSDEQIANTDIIYKIHKNYVQNESIKAFLSKVSLINETKSKAHCYKIIIGMPEFSIVKRIKIVLASFAIDIFKFFIK